MTRFESFIERVLTLAETQLDICQQFLSNPRTVKFGPKGDKEEVFDIEGAKQASGIIKEMHKVAMDIREMLRRDTQGILSMEEAIGIRDATLKVIEVYVPQRKRDDAKAELLERIGGIIRGKTDHPSLPEGKDEDKALPDMPN